MTTLKKAQAQTCKQKRLKNILISEGGAKVFANVEVENASKLVVLDVRHKSNHVDLR